MLHKLSLFSLYRSQLRRHGHIFKLVLSNWCLGTEFIAKDSKIKQKLLCFYLNTS